MSSNIITPQHVFDTVKKSHPEKYKDLKIEEVQIYASGAVRVQGKFAPGFTGNNKGRVSNKIKNEDKEALSAEDIAKFGKDAKKALEHMLETCSTRREAKEISKILITYQSPKLANVESRSVEQKTIEIKWADSSDNIIDITPEEYAIQEEALRLLESKNKSRQKAPIE